MIEEIHIRDLGVITDAVLPLGPGLTILSGETGAGKTMVVTALGMLLGRRADAGAVRVGAEKAVAEAVVNVSSDHAAVALVEDAGGDVDHEQDRASLQLSRTVAATGRSRAHVGGRSAPVARLGELGETLRRCRRDAQELVEAMNAQEIVSRSEKQKKATRIATPSSEITTRLSAVTWTNALNDTAGTSSTHASS